MDLQQIDIGGAANDGTGDTLRDGAVKINGNFSAVDDRIGTAVALATTLKEIALRGVAGAVSAYQLRRALDNQGHFVTVSSALPVEFLIDPPFTRNWGAIEWNLGEPATPGGVQSNMIADILGWPHGGPQIAALFAEASTII